MRSIGLEYCMDHVETYVGKLWQAMEDLQAKPPIQEAKSISKSFCSIFSSNDPFKEFFPMSKQVNAFGKLDDAQRNWNTKGNFEGQNWSREGSNFQPKPFVPQHSQKISQFSKPFFAHYSLNDQTNVTLMELFSELKVDKKKQSLLMEKKFMREMRI